MKIYNLQPIVVSKLRPELRKQPVRKPENMPVDTSKKLNFLA